MNKLIGGLLVISLLSKPNLLRVDYIAYEIYKSSVRIIDSIINEEKDELNITSDEDIDAVFKGIEQNKRQINTLTSVKNDIVKRIETKMDLNSYAKTAFNEEQIITFTEFVKTYEEEKVNLTKSYTELYSVDYTGMQNMLLQEDMDYEDLHSQLAGMNDMQEAIIYSLERIVSSAQAVMNLV